MTESASAPLAGSRGRFASGLRRIAAYAERQWIRCLLLVLFGAGVHVPALQGQLLWDDLYLARDNPFIKSPLLILESFRHYLFPDSFSGHYRPVQNVSYILDYFIWNTESYGYHLSNILWHVGSGILLYFLLRQLLVNLALGGSQRRVARNGPDKLSAVAFLLALLWMVHPVHSAAVDYISGRADSLAFFFACGGWLLYLQARKLTQTLLSCGCYVLAVVSGLLALCSRESGCMWILLFLLYTFCFERELGLKAKTVVLAACLGIVGIYAGLRQLPETRPETLAPASHAPVARAVLMLRALGDYGRLMVIPSNLHMERSVSEPAALISRHGWRNSIRIEYLSLGGAVVLAAFALGAFRKGAGQKARIFGASWFLLTYLPISNLFPLNATVAEHWLYLPSVGFLIFLYGILCELPARFRLAAVGLACLAVIGFSAGSFARSSDWVDAETFFRRTFVAGGSSSRVDVNLAMLYAKRGEFCKAETILLKVLEAYPDYPVARNNLADVLFRQGKTKEAEGMFDSASKTAPEDRYQYPRTWTAALNLARLRLKEKDDQAAFAIAQKARADYPGIWQVISFEAELVRGTRGPEAALPLVQEFARAHGWHSGASIALGRLFSEMGEVAKAEAAFRHASRLDVHDAEALNLIALLSVRQNKLEEACKTQRRAVARQPDQPRQYLMLSDILTKMGRADEARETLAHVSRLESMAQAVAN